MDIAFDLTFERARGLAPEPVPDPEPDPSFGPSFAVVAVTAMPPGRVFRSLSDHKAMIRSLHRYCQ